jgi:hypothetical protein
VLADDESLREKWGGYWGLTCTVVPAMIVSGFMPEWNVLPLFGWVAIAAVGAAVGGAIATPKTVRGLVAGAAMGIGVLLGVYAYVAVRGAVSGHHTFLKLEVVVGALIGAAPGMWLYAKWARPQADVQSVDQA